MDITASDFRDKKVTKIVIGSDWENYTHYAQISVVTNAGEVLTFQINKLTEHLLYDDFGSDYVSHCKLVKTAEGIFLSLDPYEELLEPDLENDGLWFKGAEIVRV